MTCSQEENVKKKLKKKTFQRFESGRIRAGGGAEGETPQAGSPLSADLDPELDLRTVGS